MQRYYRKKVNAKTKKEENIQTETTQQEETNKKTKTVRTKWRTKQFQAQIKKKH